MKEKRKVIFKPFLQTTVDDDVEIRIGDKIELEKLNYREYVITLLLVISIHIGIWYFSYYGGNVGIFLPQDIAPYYEKYGWLFYIVYAVQLLIICFLIYRRTSRSVPIIFKKKEQEVVTEDHAYGGYTIFNTTTETEKRVYVSSSFDEKITQVAEKLYIVLVELGYYKDTEENMMYFEKKGQVLQLKIPRLNRTPQEKLDKTREYMEAIFSLEIGAIWNNYEYFYIDYIEEMFVPSIQDIMTHDVFEDKVLYGFDYKGMPLYWEFLKTPNGIISSKNGQGKTVCMHAILYSLLQKDKNVEPTFIDGKGTALKRYRETYDVHSAQSSEDILKVVSNFRREMEERFIEFDEKNIENIYATTSYTRRLLCIDEHSSIIDKLETKEMVKTFMTDLDMISKLGREAGFLILTTIQQAHSRYISTDMRENAHFKAMMGSSSKSNYTLLFGSDYSSLKPLTVGQGYTLIDDVLTRFVFPKM